MTVNLPLRYRVIGIVTIAGLAFSALAWSGEEHIKPKPKVCTDSIPSPKAKPDQKLLKRKHNTEEGRVARELDLRIDADELDLSADLEGLNDMDVTVDPEALKSLKRLNRRIEADVFTNIDVWKTLEDVKVDPFMDRDAL